MPCRQLTRSVTDDGLLPYRTERAAHHGPTGCARPVGDAGPRALRRRAPIGDRGGLPTGGGSMSSMQRRDKGGMTGMSPFSRLDRMFDEWMRTMPTHRAQGMPWEMR